MRKLLKRTVTLLLAVSVAVVSGAVTPVPVWAGELTEISGEKVQAGELTEIPEEKVQAVELTDIPGEEESSEAKPEAGYEIADEAYSDTGFYIATYDP